MQSIRPTNNVRLAPKCKKRRGLTITARSHHFRPVYMSNTAPATTPNKAPWAWFCLAGAAFCRVGLGLIELGVVTTGSALTQVVVVTTTTPPLAIVELNVDVTSRLNEGDDEKVGLLVIGFDVPAGWSVHSQGGMTAQYSTRSRHRKDHHRRKGRRKTKRNG
jgi:hypothetical protein